MGKRHPDIVSATMRRVKSQNTGPEMALRKTLWSLGLRYRLHVKDLPGKPDIVFPGVRVAVFVDGDFWHGNQWRLRGLTSLEEQFQVTPHREYWIPKIKRTMVRDVDATGQLEYAGWRVLRFWESELKVDLDSCTRQIAAIVHERTAVRA